jgi:hypothetical protein
VQGSSKQRSQTKLARKFLDESRQVTERLKEWRLINELGESHYKNQEMIFKVNTHKFQRIYIN